MWILAARRRHGFGIKDQEIIATNFGRTCVRCTDGCFRVASPFAWKSGVLRITVGAIGAPIEHSQDKAKEVRS